MGLQPCKRGRRLRTDEKVVLQAELRTGKVRLEAEFIAKTWRFFGLKSCPKKRQAGKFNKEGACKPVAFPPIAKNAMDGARRIQGTSAT